MGTNYYATLDSCPHCGRGEQIHIGKSSFGWQFSFHATDSIRSWGDWKVELRRPTTIIRDEYERGVSFEEFEKMVQAKKSEPHNHSKMVLDDDRSLNGGMEFGRHHTSQCFLDSEGNSMQDGEFS